MAKLWNWGIVLFLIIGLLFSHEEEMMIGLMNTPHQTFQLVFTVISSACLWGGFLNIIEKIEFMNYFMFIFKPILKCIYGKIIFNQKIYTLLASNMVANLLGMGSLATMSGLKAFQHLQEYNSHKNYPTREMLSLVIMNTAGFCLFPSSLIMLRQKFLSRHLYAFYPYMIIISVTIIIIGLIIQRVIDHE